MNSERVFTAEQTADKEWSIKCSPPPTIHSDGRKSFSFKFYVLHVGNFVENPDKIANEVADILEENRARIGFPVARSEDAS